MKNLLLLCGTAVLLAACSSRGVRVEVSNSLEFDRASEMVEIPIDSLPGALAESAFLYVTDSKGNEIPSQITYDRKLIFLTSAKANSSVKYRIFPSDTLHRYDTIACGRAYPERDDDMGWENDLVGFRAYGPALQNRGERGFGYDIFLKRDTVKPILDMLYAIELNPESWAKTDSIRKEQGDSAAEAFIRTFSYHVDHGYGMDCYAVGPTLGAGVSALMDSGKIVYPWCYKEAEILDNGPLRFTVKLRFTPLTVGTDTSVVETRLITLDKDSHLNRTDISYEGLSRERPIATGIVLHDTEGTVTTDSEKAYISYVDPTQGTENGKVFIGAVLPVSAAETLIDRHADAPSHVLAVSPYKPGETYSYYWGFAWDRTDITSVDAWNDYLARHAAALRSPLKIKIN